MPMEMEMDTFQFAEEFIEEFFMEFEPQFMMEPEGMKLEDGPIILFADDTMMEEIYEETEELVATFLPMVSEKEEFSSEESFIQSDGPVFMEPTENTETFDEEEMMEEEMLEEPTEMAEEEMIEEETTEMAEEESVEEKPTKMVETKDEKKKETVKEKKLVSKTTKKSAVQAKKIKEQKEIQQKKALVKNLARVMDKVDKDIKNISKNLQIKNIIKLQAMTSEQVSLDTYNVAFYAPKDIYLDQLNLIDNRLIYADKSLATYIQNDKMNIKARKLMEIKSRKQKLLIELEMLKNG
jgi:hypothetical protein